MKGVQGLWTFVTGGGAPAEPTPQEDAPAAGYCRRGCRLGALGAAVDATKGVLAEPTGRRLISIHARHLPRVAVAWHDSFMLSPIRQI